MRRAGRRRLWTLPAREHVGFSDARVNRTQERPGGTACSRRVPQTPSATGTAAVRDPEQPSTLRHTAADRALGGFGTVRWRSAGQNICDRHVTVHRVQLSDRTDCIKLCKPHLQLRARSETKATRFFPLTALNRSTLRGPKCASSDSRRHDTLGPNNNPRRSANPIASAQPSTQTAIARPVLV